MTSTFTSEIHEEFELERERWLRRRFLWYAGVVIILGLLGLLQSAVNAFGVGLAIRGDNEEQVASAISLLRTASIVQLIGQLLSEGLYIAAFLRVRRTLMDRNSLLRLVFWLIVISGVLAFGSAVVGAEVADRLVEVTGDAIPPVLAGIMGLSSVFITHFFACCFLPWTPKESIRPLIPLLAINAVITVIYAGGWLGATLLILGSPLIAVPGAAICWWRQSRFHTRFALGAYKRRYGEMKQELSDARRIHEALFPKPIQGDEVTMDYRYEPMRQIGGDYLYSRFTPSPRGVRPALSVVIIDVTGHGIPAALTVNRLHGELDRLFAELPDSSPGAILTSLNRYVHLTLALHSVYVTAICLRVDPNAPEGSREGTLEWASGGHPPAFLRAVDGGLERLDSTTFVLGATHGDDFHHNQQSLPFGPGDCVVAYTDGATEARDREGRMLRIEGFQRIVAGAMRENGGMSLAECILREVERFRFGPPADDTLVVEVARPLTRS